MEIGGNALIIHGKMNKLHVTPVRLAWIPLMLLTAGSAFAQENSDGWPLVFTSGTDQVQVFKPQPESFDGTSFTARAAVALQRSGDNTPVFGAIWGNGVLAVDRSNRMGTLTSFKVTDARFPGITDAAEVARLKDMLSAGILAHAAPVAMDWMVAALEEEKLSTASYDNAPPVIIYKDKPAILLYIDGDPIYEPVKSNATNADPVYAQAAPQLERIVNSPFLVVRPKGGDNWLYGSGTWFSARNIQGPWAYQKKAPDYLDALAKQVDTAKAAPRTDGIIPEVVVSTKPAVLLDVNGAPQMQPYDNSSLMYVTNTDKDLFMYIPTQEYYLLASGRWYATKDLRNGPWRYVAPEDLPADFAKVPEGSAKDGILAHVAGTPAAREAVRDASIPQTAQVDRRSATVNVTYDGAPKFERIAGTSVYSARNASTTVLLINGSYHVCDNAVWYEGSTPDGPWTVSTQVPAEVNQIPPSDPAYRVRYVYIYDYTPDVVYIGYTPGYLGSYVQSGVVIYGTGYYYDPWRGAYWYPRPYTWGFNMYYNPWYGWGFGAAWGYSWFYPSWNYYGYYRPYSWGWWGPYGYCPSWYGHWYKPDHHGNGYYYGHRPGMSGSSGNGRSIGNAIAANRTDLYNNHRVPGVTAAQAARPAQDRNTGQVQRPATGLADRNNATMKPMQGDYFTDSKGNIYRTENGRTEQLYEGRWNAVPAQVPGGKTPLPNGTLDRSGNLQREAQPQTAPPVQRDNTLPGRERPGVPQQVPGTNRNDNPWIIQQERSRGEQRVNDFRGYEEQRRNIMRQPEAPRTSPAPSRPAAPQMRTPSPSISRPASPGGGGGSAPTRRPR